MFGVGNNRACTYHRRSDLTGANRMKRRVAALLLCAGAAEQEAAQRSRDYMQSQQETVRETQIQRLGT